MCFITLLFFLFSPLFPSFFFKSSFKIFPVFQFGKRANIYPCHLPSSNLSPEYVVEDVCGVLFAFKIDSGKKMRIIWGMEKVQGNNDLNLAIIFIVLFNLRFNGVTPYFHLEYFLMHFSFLCRFLIRINNRFELYIS